MTLSSVLANTMSDYDVEFEDEQGHRYSGRVSSNDYAEYEHLAHTSSGAAWPRSRASLAFSHAVDVAKFAVSSLVWIATVVGVLYLDTKWWINGHRDFGTPLWAWPIGILMLALFSSPLWFLSWRSAKKAWRTMHR
jgi:hypothetical protein